MDNFAKVLKIKSFFRSRFSDPAPDNVTLTNMLDA
jgi:hypothetical protein